MQLMQQSSQAQEPTPQISTDSDSGSGDGKGAASGSKLAVYVGDSPSDFAPLLRADLGVVVGHNKLLRQVAKAHGVKLTPLTAGQHAWDWGRGLGWGVVHGSSHANNSHLSLCQGHMLQSCSVVTTSLNPDGNDGH